MTWHGCMTGILCHLSAESSLSGSVLVIKRESWVKRESCVRKLITCAFFVMLDNKKGTCHSTKDGAVE